MNREEGLPHTWAGVACHSADPPMVHTQALTFPHPCCNREGAHKVRMNISCDCCRMLTCCDSVEDR
jgi:hypothetical protein